jgi:signal transduction histidine kinase
MKKLLKLIAVTLAILAATPSWAGELGSADEAVAMVRKAAAMLNESGRDKTIAEANNPKGRFVDRDLYVVIHDMNGKVLANPVLPRMIGMDLSAVKDVDGKAFMKERLDMLKTSGGGWIDFKWPNSVTKHIEKRSVYFERVGDLVFTCGILKH